MIEGNGMDIQCDIMSEDRGFVQEAGGACVVVPHRIIDILECRDRPSLPQQPLGAAEWRRFVFRPTSGRPLGMTEGMLQVTPRQSSKGNPAAFEADRRRILS
jgi:hypothetical protein